MLIGDKETKWCIVCGRLINPLSQRRKTCGKFCRERYNCGETPYLSAPKRNTIAEIALLAAAAGQTYGKYVADKGHPVIIDRKKPKEPSDMPIYINCPYFKREEHLRLFCEGAVIKFPDSKARLEYVTNHCASLESWTNCTVAKCLNDYFDKKDEKK